MKLSWVGTKRNTRLFAAALALAAAVVLCAGLGLALAAGQPGALSAPHAAVYVVNSTADLPDVTRDGVCAASTGACTLRAALEEANAGAEPAVIQFDMALPASILLDEFYGPLLVQQSMAIQGPTTGELRIDGQNLTSHLDIDPTKLAGPMAVSITHLSFVRGKSIADGGSVLVRNSAQPLNVAFERVVFDGNTAPRQGGAIFSDGQRLRISDSLFTNNSAAAGGAVANVGGSLEIWASSLSKNRADTNGGALFNSDRAGTPGSDGVMTVTVSTLAYNDAGNRGGAIYNAILNDHGVQTWIRGSTIVSNTAQSAGGGIYNGWASNLVMNTSILAANLRLPLKLLPVPNDCTSSASPPVGFRPMGAAPDGFLTGGDNIIGAGAVINCPTSQSDILYDPALIFDPVQGVLDARLRSYDGSQPMFALLPGSPARKNPAIDRTTAGSALCGSPALHMDQRGAPKPLGPRCDIGAYEAALPQIAVTRTVSLSPNACTNAVDLELATGVKVYPCATIVNAGNVAFTRTLLSDRASGRQYTLGTIQPGQVVTLTSRQMEMPDGQTANGDLLGTIAGQGVSQFSTPPGLAPEVAGQGTSSVRPLDVSMMMTSQVFGFGAIRTITTTTTYHQDGTRVKPHTVLGEVTGGTRASLAPVVTENGVAVFSYLSTSPLTPFSGAVRGSGAQQSLVARPDAVDATDTIRVWVDLNGNGVWDPFEPMTLAQVPTAIDLASFTAQSLTGQGVRLQWRTGSESNVAGFNVLRAGQPDGPYQKVNADLIPSQAAGLGGAYEYTDRTAGRGTYYYKLEEVGVDGQTLIHGPVSVIVLGDPVGSENRVYLPFLFK